MRRSVLGFLFLVAASLAAGFNSTDAAERPAFSDPKVLTSEAGFFRGTLTAKEEEVDVPGLGAMSGAYLYGFSVNGAALPSFALNTDVWSVQPGDTLEFRFDNSLPCSLVRPDETAGSLMSQSNIHTHGFIVSPGVAADGAYGDNVFVLADSSVPPSGGKAGCQPGAAASHHGIDEKSGSIVYRIKIPDNHDSGLYWFHPHAHGVSQEQIARGLSGLISIGSVWDYAWINCVIGDAASPFACPNDAQSSEEQSLRHETEQHFVMLKDIQVARGKDGKWHTAKWYDASFCGEDGYPRLVDGACSPKDSADRKWLVTVNGALAPRLVSQKGKAQLLRIANVSASASYNLEFRGNGKLLPFQIVSNDGVSAGQAADKRITDEGRILLMPSARIEIYIDPAEVCAALGSGCDGSDVETAFEIGEWQCPAGTDGDCADLWPTGRVMEIVFAGLSQGAPKHPLAVDTSDLADALLLPGSNAAGPDIKCSDGQSPAPALRPGESRLIAFWNGTIGKDEIFTMKTDAAPRQGMPSLQVPEDMTKKWLAANGFKPFDHARTDLCLVAGRRESWIVFNAADEYHNFHVHQSKFRVVELSSPDAETRAIGDTVLHDNYPIPPNTWIRIEVEFSDAVAGRFVYHCHILEHEDKGMMSVIEVLPSGG